MSYNHIIKTSDGRILYFFLKEGLCVKDLLLPYDKYKIIYEEAVCDFYVADCADGEIGIVCQDNDGSIIFLKENNETYLKTTLLNNRSKLPYDKNFKIFNNNLLSLSYIINYQDKNILSFQFVERLEEPPEVIDYIDDLCYFAFSDRSGDINFFYNKEGSFGLKIYKWGKKSFLDFENLGEGSIISVIADKNDNFYIIYKEEDKFYLKAIIKYDFEIDYKEKELDFLRADDNVNMLIEKNNLWITVKRNSFTFGKRCDINTFEFSSTYNFANEGDLKNYTLSINEEDYVLEKCFGYSLDMRPKLILYKDLMNVDKTIKPKNEFTEEDEFNEFLGIKKEEESEIIKEVTKLTIRTRELEERIKKLEDLTLKT